MKRLLFILAFVASTLNVQAWTKEVDGASRVLALKYMSKEAIAEYKRISSLAKSLPAEQVRWVFDKESRVWLDSSLRAVATDEKDIVVRIERAVDVLRNRAKYSDLEVYKALQTIQRLMPELHNIATVAIEGIEASQSGFSFTWTAGKEGSKKREQRGTISWRGLWTRNFCFMHQGWSANYYAYDIDIRFGSERAKMQQGSVRDWAQEVGSVAKPMYEWAKPDMILRNEPRLLLEDVHLSMVARAGYRMAVLLNDALK